MSGDELIQLRKKIDDIDSKLIPLFCERMDTALKVALYKKENGLPVLDSTREKAILSKLSSAGEYESYAVILYQILMDLSRALQHDTIANTSEDYIDAGTSNFDCTAPCRIACFGREGAYAHIASCKLFSKGDITFFSTFGSTAEALLKDDRFDYALLPVENSTAGSVAEVYDILINNPLYIVAGMEIPVKHCLLGVNGASIETIKQVHSHKQALSQCSDFIKANGMQPVEESSTASAAYKVSAGYDISHGAIASEAAAKKYGLNIICNGIQNTSNNSTRFVALSRNLCYSPDADKISIVFSLDHEPGTLYRTLARFAALGLNLTKIESRPKPESNFEYMFYLDFAGNINKEETRHLLSTLKNELLGFKVLGNYKDHRLAD